MAGGGAPAYINQYLKRFIKVDIDIDAIAFIVGDIINAQCDVPQWGEGGRIVALVRQPPCPLY